MSEAAEHSSHPRTRTHRPQTKKHTTLTSATSAAATTTACARRAVVQSQVATAHVAAVEFDRLVDVLGRGELNETESTPHMRGENKMRTKTFGTLYTNGNNSRKVNKQRRNKNKQQLKWRLLQREEKQNDVWIFVTLRKSNVYNTRLMQKRKFATQHVRFGRHRDLSKQSEVNDDSSHACKSKSYRMCFRNPMLPGGFGLFGATFPKLQRIRAVTAAARQISVLQPLG